MISKKMAEMLNEQLNKEYFSSYLYLSMAAYCADRSLEGFANWFRVQAQEEHTHALKFYDYLQQQQARVLLKAISEPPADFSSVSDAATQALKHEKFVTKSIHEIYTLAAEERDYATQNFLNWFVTEQVEEEASAQLLVDKLEMIGESKGSLLYLDKEAKKRTAAE